MIANARPRHDRTTKPATARATNRTTLFVSMFVDFALPLMVFLRSPGGRR